MAVAAENSRRFTPGAYHGFRAIKLACKSERVPVDWDGSYADLARLFTEEFTQNEARGFKAAGPRERGGVLDGGEDSGRSALWDPKTRRGRRKRVLDDARDDGHRAGNFEMYDRMLVVGARCVERKQAAKASRRAATLASACTARQLLRLERRSTTIYADSSRVSVTAAASSSGLRAMGSLRAMRAVLLSRDHNR